VDLLHLIGQKVKPLDVDTRKDRERGPFDKAFNLMVVELHKSGKSSG
jgi:hypothetical protein